jgi:hypothetical protein
LRQRRRPVWFPSTVVVLALVAVLLGGCEDDGVCASRQPNSKSTYEYFTGTLTGDKGDRYVCRDGRLLEQP